MTSRLSPRELAFYRDNGYLVIERFIAPERCEALAREADAQAAGHYANMLDLHVRSPAFHDLLVDPAILTLEDQ